MMSNDKELLKAVFYNQIPHVKQLLSHMNAEQINAMHDSKGADGEMTPLHLAALKGHVEILELLIKSQKVNANLLTSKTKRTALHLAVIAHCPQACRLLLPYTNLLAKDSRSKIPYSFNYLAKDAEEAKKIIEVEDVLRVPTFVMACQEGNLELVKSIGGIDINAKYNGCWGLERACLHNRMEVIDYLLSLPQLEINQCDDQGNTILHLMPLKVLHNQPTQNLEEDLLYNKFPLQNCNLTKLSIQYQIIEKLIKQGLDPNIRNHSNVTPLFLATCFNVLDIVKALVTNGADLNLKYTYFLENSDETKERYNKALNLYYTKNPEIKERIQTFINQGNDMDIYSAAKNQTFILDIIEIAQERPEIQAYLKMAKLYGIGKLGELKAANERSPFFECNSNNSHVICQQEISGPKSALRIL
jgi:ankyrin repeat protein